MASFKLVALIVAVIIGSFVVQAEKFGLSRCGREQHFDNCGKQQSCQRSCERPEGRVCMSICTPTCMCDGDRVWNKFNECVHLQECRGGRRMF